MDVPSDKMIGMSVSQNVIDETLKTLSWQTGFHPHPLKSWKVSKFVLHHFFLKKDYCIAFYFRY